MDNHLHLLANLTDIIINYQWSSAKEYFYRDADYAIYLINEC